MNILVSLIGSNPLPIYTVARYMSENNRANVEKEILPIPHKHLFVYTNDTKKYYDNMVNLLEEKFDGIDIQGLNLYDSQHQGDKIITMLFNEIKKISDKENNSIDNIVLNNTGGTKPMAVYSTLAIVKYAEENRGVNEKECYLDSTHNVIRVNSIGDDRIKGSKTLVPSKGDLTEFLSDMEIYDILLMHDMTNPKNAIKTRAYEDLKNERKKLVINKSDLISFVEAVGNDEVWPKVRSIFEDIDAFTRNINSKNGSFSEMIRRFLEVDEIIDGSFKESLGEKYQWLDTLSKSNKDKQKCEFINKLVNIDENKWIKDILPIFDDESLYDSKGKAEGFVKFILGDWLEQYVLLAIEKAIDELDMREKIKVYPSFVCRITNENKPEFEVDIVLLKGYKIYAFTITTAGEESSSILKGKAFEGLHRIEQLGGEHAKLTVVNMSNNNNLKNELESFNSSFYKSTKIINRSEIGNYNLLISTIKDIIR